MRVALATQVFSRTVVAGIRTMFELNKFSTQNRKFALSTANFCEKMDKLFDNLNSKTLYSRNNNRSALKPENHIIENLIFMKSYIKQLKCEKNTINYCFKGLSITINAVIELSNIFFKENSNIEYLITSRFNQDPLENTFAIIRGKGGHNKNPSVLEFSRIAAQLMCIKLLKNTDISNCENDEDKILSNFTEFYEKENPQLSFNNDDKIEIEDSSESILLEENFQLQELCSETEKSFNFDNSVDDASLKYFIGYLFFTCNKSVHCEVCQVYLIKAEEVISLKNEYFIYFKNYSQNSDFGSLHTPSEVFFKLAEFGYSYIL